MNILLKEKQKNANLELATIHIDKSRCLWENVLWTDETKLELFGKSYQLYVQTANERSET